MSFPTYMSANKQHKINAAHGDRAAVGVDVDAQGSGLREDKTHFPLNACIMPE